MVCGAEREAAGFVFPAGGVDPGEATAVSAARETQEEAGAIGQVVCSIGSFRVCGQSLSAFASC